MSVFEYISYPRAQLSRTLRDFRDIVLVKLGLGHVLVELSERIVRDGLFVEAGEELNEIGARAQSHVVGVGGRLREQDAHRLGHECHCFGRRLERFQLDNVALAQRAHALVGFLCQCRQLLKDLFGSCVNQLTRKCFLFNIFVN